MTVDEYVKIKLVKCADTLMPSSMAKLLSDISNENASALFEDCKFAIEYAIENGDYSCKVSLRKYPVYEITKVVESLEEKRGYTINVDIDANMLLISWGNEEK